MRRFILWVGLACFISIGAELRVPAFTAYLDPDTRGAQVNAKTGISGWTNPKETVSWFGEIKKPGTIKASIALNLPKDATSSLRLTVGEKSLDATATGTGDVAELAFGEYDIKEASYVRFQLTSLNASGQSAGTIDALILDGAAAEGAHFNLLPRRNAASVHLAYKQPDDAPIALFYNEVTAVEDPVSTYYMACGFSRGYCGMQVNSLTERRIIFSVWDSGSGTAAKTRQDVKDEDQVQLLAHGDGVEASTFGNEGTGGHSHFVYPWKTGSIQRFVVTAKPDGTHTEYSGYWWHPEQNKWLLLATFRAPKDGKYLRGLYSFSEDFDGSSGHIRRKALYGPQWLQTADGKWREQLTASFSHDGTGKADRLDRFMGVENGRFFLSQGGFVNGFTKYGEVFTRPASDKPPIVVLPGASK
jgi:hypothetical protein